MTTHKEPDEPVARESGTTPLILTGAVAIVCAMRFLLMLALALLAYRLAA